MQYTHRTIYTKDLPRRITKDQVIIILIRSINENFFYFFKTIFVRSKDRDCSLILLYIVQVSLLTKKKINKVLEQIRL